MLNLLATRRASLSRFTSAHTVMVPLLGFVSALLLSFAGTLVQAQSCLAEVEPNDTPATGTLLEGVTCGVGGLAGQDQDAFTWTVSEEESRHLWTVGIEGIAGNLTKLDIFRIEFAEDGAGVVAADSLYSFGTRDGRPVESGSFLINPGRYTLGISKSGGEGEYLAILHRGERLPGGLASSGESFASDFALHSLMEGGEAGFGWVVSEEDAKQRWTLALRTAVGETIALTLEDAAGNVVLERSGSGTGPLTVADIGLESGTYSIGVSGAADRKVIYSLQAEAQGYRTDGHELEPNDDPSQASELAIGTVLEGSFPGGDHDDDHFAFTVGPEQAGKSLQLNVDTASLVEVVLSTSEGVELQSRTGNGGALRNLVLEEGLYRLLIGSREAGDYALSFELGGEPREGIEREPNDNLTNAHLLGEGRTIRGTLMGSDVDAFRLVIDGEPQLWRVQALANGGEIEELSFYDAQGARTQSQRGKGQRRVRLSNLYLLPGEHYLTVRGRQGEVEYALRMVPLGPPEGGASPAAAAEAGTATVPPAHVPDPTLHDPGPAAGDAAGVDGNEAQAAVTILPPGPRPEGRMELEPNDDGRRAEKLSPGSRRVGLLSEADDNDVYRFHLSARSHVRLTITPPVDGELNANLSWLESRIAETEHTLPGDTLVYEALLAAGDYELDLWSDEGFESYYAVGLELLDPFDLPADIEPNDEVFQAQPLPGTVVSGQVGRFEGYDWYRLPIFEQEVSLKVRREGTANPGVFVDEWRAPNLLTSVEEGVWEGVLPAGEPLFLRVERSSYKDWESDDPFAYSLQLDFAAEVPGLTPAPTSTVTLELGAAEEAVQPTVAAYWPRSQRLELELRMRNGGEEPATLTLDAWTGDADFELETPAGGITLQPGEERSLALPLQVAPGVKAGPLLLAVAASDTRGASVSTTTELLVEPLAEPVNPHLAFAPPEEILGGLNVAWAGLGSQPFFAAPTAQTMSNKAEDDDRSPEEWQRDRFNRYGAAHLFDDLATYAHDYYDVPIDSGFAPTVDLAGDEPVEIIGFALHPLSTSHPFAIVRDFRVEASLDGVNFREVLAGVLIPEWREQYFLLEEPVAARFIRFHALSNQARPLGAIGGVSYAPRYGQGRLGEFKVITGPETDLLGGRGFNLAHPASGGHLIWSDPPGIAHSNAMLMPDSESTARLAREQSSTEWVLGFHHERAAQITGLEWVATQIEAGNERPTFERVEVAVSVESPLGPWRSLGVWEVGAGPEDGVPPFLLEEPTWARYLRFRVTGLTPRETYRYPDTIEVFERPVGEEYRSILGEWGHSNREAVFEWLVRDPVVPVREESDDNDTLEAAELLRVGEVLSGSVLRQEDVDWFRISVPEGQNLLSLTLEGEPTLGFDYRLVDEAGTEVFTEVETTPSSVHLEAYVEPGEYFLHLDEPPRSIVFIWDTSGSAGAYLDMVYQSLTQFALDVTPGVEVVNLHPFDPGFLLPHWSDDSVRILRALNAFDGRAGASKGEAALTAATLALSERQGKKAIIFMTDAAISREAGLWRVLEEVEPQIFTLSMTSAGAFGPNPQREQDLMEELAAVNGGFYQYTSTQGDLDVAFERLSAWLNRPARYLIEPRLSYREPPGPGLLSVTRPESAALPAVEVIFDASGSMGARLPNGEQKIAVAKGVLNELVTQIIPAGTPFALRAFGHIMPSSCETRLDIPVAPLDPLAAADVIGAIEPKLLSQTPIADSLLAVPADLADAAENSTIILITDGEESCDGDPAAALAVLREQGLDVRLSVVSLGLDDATVRQQFADLAAQGGGEYVNAADASSLRSSIEAALYPTFEVVDGDGVVVATGRVDSEPVELEMGIYQVRLPDGTSQKVRVPGDGSVTVEVAGQ